MATKIYYKEITDPDDGSKTKPVLIDDLFAVKKSLSESDNVPKEKEVGIKEIGRDLSNLFQLIEDDTDKQYVPASYAELSHYNAEYKSSMKDLSEVFALKSATLITDEAIKTKALSELGSGEGPRVQNPAVSANFSVPTIPLSNLGVHYKIDIYGRNIYGDNPDVVHFIKTDYFDSPEGSLSYRYNITGLGGERWSVVTPIRFL